MRQPDRSNKAFHTEVAASLRAKIEQLESKLRAAQTTIRALENAHLKLERQTYVAEADREALYDAVRALAEVVSNVSIAGRKARETARKLLESKRIRPPASLGSSRERKKRRKKVLTPRSERLQ